MKWKIAMRRMEYRKLPHGEEKISILGIGTSSIQGASGVCVYCNHCKPCPVGLDVGQMNVSAADIVIPAVLFM